MFVNIRSSVFETNSSSAHSIVVKKDGGKTNSGNIVLQNGAWIVEKTRSLCFGREFDILGTAAEKACFAIASLRMFAPYKERGRQSSHNEAERKNERMLSDILHIMQKVCPDMSSIKLPMMEEEEYFVKGVGSMPEGRLKYKRWDEETGKSIYVFIDEDGTERPALPIGQQVMVPNYGDIDHQSCGLLKIFFGKHPNISLEQFILDSRYVVVIDSDEIDTFGGLAASGILDLDNVDDGSIGYIVDSVCSEEEE